MRLLSLSLWLPALAAAGQVATDFNGRLYIYEKSSPSLSNKHTPIDHEAARLIIAQRLGVDRYHDTGAISTDTINALNDLGGESSLLQDELKRPVAVLLSSENRRHYKEHLEPFTHFAIINAIPSLRQTQTLWTGFAAQKYAAENRRPVFSKDNADQGIFYEDDTTLIRQISRFPEPGLLIEQYRREGYDVILIISPKQWASKTYYGHFEWPMVTLDKRQVQEKPLEEELDTPTPNETISPYKSSNDTTPLRGILPFCYSSKEACESTTRNCTGHGSCKVAYTQKDDAGDEKGVPCYACSCTPTIKENKGGGKKTTVWSGPACQKKDVVAPFWLIAGFSILMVFLVSWAVGTIWSMGEEELPSVIGAGVSGVPRK
ncbi:Hypothetical protein D9617_2g059350 [Elsinoe fawcettii]|nr:Hypothetical protein D9617_2g059350 [Elsinoe fawcettii]